MLTNPDSHIGVAMLSLSPELFNGVLLQNGIARIPVAERKFGLPAGNLLMPLRQIRNVLVRQSRVQSLQCLANVAVNRNMSFLVLVNFGCVNVDMHDLAVLRKLFQLARDSIIKTHPERQQQVRLVDRIVGVDSAVHAQHVQRLGMSPRENSQTHHRHRDRNAGPQSELREFF